MANDKKNTPDVGKVDEPPSRERRSRYGGGSGCNRATAPLGMPPMAEKRRLGIPILPCLTRAKVPPLVSGRMPR